MGVRIALSLQDTGQLRARHFNNRLKASFRPKSRQTLKNEQNISLRKRVVQRTDPKGQLAVMEPASEFGDRRDGGFCHPRGYNISDGFRVQTSGDHDL